MTEQETETSETETPEVTILVLGDLIFDTIILTPKKSGELSDELSRNLFPYNLRIRRPGGTLLLRNVIKEAVWYNPPGQAPKEMNIPEKAAVVMKPNSPKGASVWDFKTQDTTPRLLGRLITYDDLDIYRDEKNLPADGVGGSVHLYPTIQNDLTDPGFYVSHMSLYRFPQSRELNSPQVLRFKESAGLGYLYSRSLTESKENKWDLSLRNRKKSYDESLHKKISSLVEAKESWPCLFNPSIVVIDDLNLGFRDYSDKGEQILSFLDENPHFSSNKRDGFIIWRMEYPLAKWPLWDAVINGGYADRIILIVSGENLREAGLDLRDEHPLEHKAHSLHHLVHHSELAEKLSRCNRLVIRFNNGVLQYSKQTFTTKEKIEAHYHPLVDGKTMDGSPDLGRMIGYTHILTAALVKGIACALMSKAKSPGKNLDEKRIESYISAGLRLGVVLGYRLFENGFADFGLKAWDVSEGELAQNWKAGEVPRPLERVFWEWDREQVERSKRKEKNVITVSFTEKKFITYSSFEVPQDFIDYTYKKNRLKQSWTRVDDYCEVFNNTSVSNAPETAAIAIVLQGLKEISEKTCEEVYEKMHPDKWRQDELSKAIEDKGKKTREKDLPEWAPRARNIPPLRQVWQD